MHKNFLNYDAWLPLWYQKVFILDLTLICYIFPIFLVFALSKERNKSSRLGIRIVCTQLCHIYTTVSTRVVNRWTRKTVEWMICNMKQCNITYRLLIIAPLYENNKTTALIKIVTWMHSFPLIFLWFIYQNVSNSIVLWNNTRRYEMLPTLNLGCSFIILIETRNNQQPICDIALLNKNKTSNIFPLSN
jgi:hypothetical protein